MLTGLVALKLASLPLAMQFSLATISFPGPRSVSTPFPDLAPKLSIVQSPTESPKLAGYDSFFRSSTVLSGELRLYIVITSASYIFPQTPYSINGQSMLRLISTLFVTVSHLEKSVFYMFQQHHSTRISSPKVCRHQSSLNFA